MNKFTDSHPTVKLSKARIDPEYRSFTGAGLFYSPICRGRCLVVFLLGGDPLIKTPLYEIDLIETSNLEQNLPNPSTGSGHRPTSNLHQLLEQNSPGNLLVSLIAA